MRAGRRTSHKEKLDVWKGRLRDTALGLEESAVEKAQGSMYRRCRELETSGGNWVKRDC